MRRVYLEWPRAPERTGRPVLHGPSSAGLTGGMTSHPSTIQDPRVDVLLVRARGWLCALRLDDVLETLRPLRTEPVAGAPPFVRGVTVLRGESVPVVRLSSLLHPHEGPAGARFVAVRAGGRTIALEVDEVIGVEPVSLAELTAAAPLMGSALSEHTEA